jgi:O-antigen/teichoic acid export membrane protein
LDLKLSIIIPAYNEEARLGAMLEAYTQYFLRHYGDDVEFLVVVNGSRDHTEDIARLWARRHPQVNALVEPEPIGKGGAIMMGMRHARGDLIGFVDADLSTPPEAFDDLVKNIGKAGIIIASRWIAGARVSPKQPLKRRIASRIFNGVVRLFFGLRIHDTQCGAKLMTREAVSAVLPQLGITRWAFDVDLLFQMRRAGFAVIERATVWRDAPGSQLQVARAGMEMFLAIARLRLLYSPLRWVVALYDRTLGRLIHLPPQGLGMEGGSVLKHGTILLAATIFGSMCNMLFHVVMGRALPPAEYGVLASMLGLVLIAGTPMDALRTALTHFAACMVKEGRPGGVKSLVWRGFGWMVLPALAVGIGGAMFGKWIAGFFQILEPAPVVWTAWVLGASFFMPIVLGALLGMQSFLWMSVAQHSWGAVRLLAAAFFVLYVSRSAMAGIWAQGLGVLATVVLGVGGVYAVIREPAEKLGPQDRMGGYFLQSLVALAGFAVLMNADVLLVKRFFGPNEAGLFARAGTIGRIMVFLTTPIAMAMFPKVASKGESGAPDWRHLLHATLYAVLLLGGAAAAASLAPGLPLWILYGDRQPDASMILLVRAMTWAMAPLGVAMVLLNFEIAQHRFRAAWGLVVCAAAYLAGVAVWHRFMWQVPLVLGPASTMALALLMVEIRGPLRRRASFTSTSERGCS